MAIVLLAHGSPDPDWRRPLAAVRDRVRELEPEQQVELAVLDDFAEVVARLQSADVHVVPVFLSPGGRHIKKDIPALVEAAAQAHPQVKFHLRPGALGEHPLVIEALAQAAIRG